MTVLGSLFERRTNLENPTVPLSGHNVGAFLDAGFKNHSGVTVNEHTALNMSAVWGSVNLISGVSAALPLKTFRKNSKERVVVRLLDNPHPDMTPFELWRLVYVHLCLWGNAYLRKVRNSAGVVTWLEPIHPSCVKVGRVHADEYTPNGKVFQVTDTDGSQHAFTSFDILHFPGFSTDGVCGISPISVARQSIGLGLAAEQYGAELFGNGSLMSGILQSDQRLDQETATALKQRWKDTVGRGLGGAHEIAVLGAGAKFQPVTMPNSDAQFIESRRFQIAEVGRWFGLPGHMLNDTEKATTWGSGIESMSLGMVVFTLRPRWLTPVEQRVTKEATPTGIYAEWAVEGLMRGDSAARAAFYTALRNLGVFSANEIRGFENLPPIPDGDTYLQPLNMTPLGSADVNASPTPPVPPDA